MQILIVDDNSLALDMLEHLLRREGFDVLRASSGREALEILEQGNCRMVISDWEMPEMTGLELCRQIRNSLVMNYIYIILLTARGDASDVIEGMSAGADDYIVKPFQPSQLTLRVRTGERLLGLETRELLIFVLTKLAESRDSDTGRHLERVRRFSRTLAEHLARAPKYRGQINTEFVRLIFLTSPLHDIGKVAVPDMVLLKPGPLTRDEFEMMKSHTTHGAATLDAALKEFPAARYLRMARDIAISHHEWYDGSGYPNGLARDEIPLCGRIVALADVYDALTSKRVYKDVFTHEKARAILLQARGSHFDPDVVDAFVANEDKFIAIQQEFGEPAPAATERPLIECEELVKI
jgi:putative two-component system response regulator